MSEERYDIKEKIGEGGAGSVYIAHDTRLDREVALKRVSAEEGGWDEETVDDMLKEARMLSSISHPNIVTIYDADVDEDGPYVVMELLKGRNIDTLIAENTLTPSDFEEFCIQCLEALIAAHSLNLIHRDIKPNNIVLKWLPSGQFQAKLLDFGMAKLTKEPTKQTVDQTDSVFGSIYFMAPEQFERTELDARTDLYALGSVFYYTLTGVYPFTGESPAEVMASHLTHRVKPVSDYRPELPEWVGNWVMWLINRSMDDRPQTAQEALDLFNENLKHDPLKNTGAVSTKFEKEEEGAYFGREKGKEGSSIFNFKAAQNQSAEVLAPVVMEAPTAGGVPSEQSTTPAVSPAAPTPENNASVTAAPSPPEENDPSLGQPVELPSQQDLAKAKSRNKGLVAILSVVGIALLIGVSLIFMQLKKNKEVAKINTLLAPAKSGDLNIPTSKNELETLLSQLYTVSGEFDNELIYRRIATAKSSDDTDIDEKITWFATQKGNSVISDVRNALFKVLRQRGAKPSDSLEEFILNYEEEEVTINALTLYRDGGSDKHADFLINLIVKGEGKKRSEAEASLTGIIERTNNTDFYNNKLNAANDIVIDPLRKASLNRLLALLGGESGKERILKGLKSKDRTQIIPALSMLANWKDDSLTEEAITFWEKASKELRPKSYATVLKLCKTHHLENEEDLTIWKRVAKGAKTRDEKLAIINALTSTRKKYVIPVIKPFTGDKNKDVKSRAERAMEVLSEK